ncbi:MAG TPA: endonuclease III [Acidobacteriaceae bacterium]|jgi:endonuclease-3|nr:endonuclease III [Acidobacteriaceae bacterium]
MTPARKANTSKKSKKKAAKTKAAAPRAKASAPKVSAKGPSKTKPKADKLPDLAPQRIEEILARLDQNYPQARCALHHRNAWELLVATILSAQCTDVRVNIVTPELFRRFPTPEAMSVASLPELESLVRTTGFFRNKAKNILAASKRLVNDFGGNVPAGMEQLLSLPGVARKTANVVLGSWFGIAEGVVVDTHVLRISYRLGLTKATTPEKVEQDLVRILPKSHWIDYSHQIIYLGRQICIARKPRCADCFLEDLCHSKDKTWSTQP